MHAIFLSVFQKAASSCSTDQIANKEIGRQSEQRRNSQRTFEVTLCFAVQGIVWRAGRGSYAATPDTPPFFLFLTLVDPVSCLWLFSDIVVALMD